MLKQHECELAPVDLTNIPVVVISIVEEHGSIVDVRRFIARNRKKEITSGYAFQTDKGVVVIREGATLKYEKAVGVHFVSKMPLEDAVSGLFCHTIVKVSSYNHNRKI